MKITDVKEIHDIPGIEHYTDKMFTMLYINIPDKSAGFEHKDFERKTIITVDVITDAKTIMAVDKLSDIVFGENIHYLQWSTRCMLLDTKTVHAYRPLVDESEKTY